MNSQVPFDAALLHRYEGFGPRYTSYPTVPQFLMSFGEEQLRRAAWFSNVRATPQPLSIYLHIPYCFSPCFYCGCNRRIAWDLSVGARYVEHLLQELRLVAPLFDTRPEVMQLHLGGGTPNFLPPAELGRLVSTLGTRFRLSTAPDRDFSIELDPRHVHAGDVAALAALGFNRASLGGQDFDPRVRRPINRCHGVAATSTLI